MRPTTRPHILAVLLAVLAALGLVSSAAAQTDGRLSANGSGSAVVDGRVVVYGSNGGRNAQIRIEDRSGDASFIANGRPVTPKRTRKKSEFRYTGPATFVVSGTQVRIEITGDIPSLSVVGIGQFRLSGRGSFTLNDAFYPAWRGKQMSLAPPAASVRRGRRTQSAAQATVPVAPPPVPVPAAP